MRLSEKGCIHLNEWMVHKLPVDAFEFKPEDFTGAVVLTTDEAEQLERLLNGFVSLHNDYCLTVRNDIFDTVVIFKKRIKQSEKENDR